MIPNRGGAICFFAALQFVRKAADCTFALRTIRSRFTKSLSFIPVALFHFPTKSGNEWKDFIMDIDRHSTRTIFFNATPLISFYRKGSFFYKNRLLSKNFFMARWAPHDLVCFSRRTEGEGGQNLVF